MIQSVVLVPLKSPEPTSGQPVSKLILRCLMIILCVFLKVVLHSAGPWLARKGGSGGLCAKAWSWVPSWPAAWSCFTASPPHRSTLVCLSKTHHTGAHKHTVPYPTHFSHYCYIIYVKMQRFSGFAFSVVLLFFIFCDLVVFYLSWAS